MAGGDQDRFGGGSGQSSFGAGRFMSGRPNWPGAGQAPEGLARAPGFAFGQPPAPSGLAPWDFRVPTPVLPPPPQFARPQVAPAPAAQPRPVQDFSPAAWVRARQNDPGN